jgi:hypothetical protein
VVGKLRPQANAGKFEMALESILVKTTGLRKYIWVHPWIHEEECGKGMKGKCISMEECWFLGTTHARVEGKLAHKVEPAAKDRILGSCLYFCSLCRISRWFGHAARMSEGRSRTVQK